MLQNLNENIHQLLLQEIMGCLTGLCLNSKTQLSSLSSSN